MFPIVTRNQLWADLMRRTFGFDVLACPRCGGLLRLVALIEQAAVIERILRHLDLPAEIPAPRPARAPPLAAGDPDPAWVRRDVRVRPVLLTHGRRVVAPEVRLRRRSTPSAAVDP